MARKRINRSKKAKLHFGEFERLEPRLNMSGLYLNELHFRPLFGDVEKDQYIEIRSDSGSQTIPNGTYLVVLEGSTGLSDAGHIHTMFDLSNQLVGPNGFLVIAESGNRYTFDPQARVLVGTDGFKGLPNNMFSTENTLSNHIDFIVGANSYLLIQTNVKPQIGDDIDTNDDGTPDQFYSNWNVLDGFSALPWVENVVPLVGYAPIVFREDGVGSAPIAKTIIDTEDLAYAARIGDSIGYSAGEWIAGNTVDENNNSSPAVFRLQHGIFGTPRPYPFSGRTLDHLGSSNFNGNVSGLVFQDANADGIQQVGEAPLPGLEIKIDANGDGMDVAREFLLEPDDYEDRAELTNEGIGITLTHADDKNLPVGFVVRSAEQTLNATNHVFASEGIPWFSDSGRLRMDFYLPANSITIKFTGTGITPVYGRLEAFDKSGTSLGFVRSSPLFDEQSQDISLSFPTASIAYAVAYCDDKHLGSNPFGRLDKLRYSIPDFSVMTGNDGSYRANMLIPGDYLIKASTPGSLVQQYPTTPPFAYGLTVTKGESLPNANFSFLPNSAPSFNAQTLNLPENKSNGSVVGRLIATDTDLGQEIAFSILSGNGQNIFSLNGSDIVLNKTQLINFESTTSYVLNIRATDNHTSPASRDAAVTIQVQDANDPPIVGNLSASVDENADSGTFVAKAVATDEDAGSNTFSFAIVNGNPGGLFAIDAATGDITVNGAIDFESATQYLLVVSAQDAGSPPAAGTGTVTVTVRNVNEAPTIVTNQLSFVENGAAGSLLPEIVISDPDTTQTSQLTIVGGTASSLLEVVGTSKQLRLKAGTKFDFETQSQWTIEVLVEDSGTPKLSDTQFIQLNVLDGNDLPVITGATYSISENSPSTQLIGKPQATDQDQGQTLSYSLVAGQDAAKFRIDANSGEIFPAADALLDFETQPKLVVRVQVNDSSASSGSSSALVTVNLTNVNDAPTISDSSFSIDENSPAASAVGTVTGSDQDAGEVLTYSIPTNDFFEINASSGAVTVKAGASLNFEQIASHVLDVSVKDKGNLTATAKVTIAINNVNEPPRVNGSINDVTIPPGQPWSMTLPSTLFVDDDADDQLLYAATDGAGFSLPTWLTFNRTTRTFTGNPTASNAGPLNVRVSAVDKGLLTTSLSFTITVESEANWHNDFLPVDVDGSLLVSPRDALVIINYLNLGLPTDAPQKGMATEFAMDVTNDGFISPLDALRVINHLNLNGTGEGEGSESNSMVATNLPTQRPHQSLDEVMAMIAFDQDLRKRRFR